MANLDKNKKKIAEQVASWSDNEFAELVKIYDKTHKAKHKQLLSKLYSSDMEKQLIENGINSSCPYCGSDEIVKRGRDSHNQRFFCNNCSKNFTCVTNTFLEKSNFNWKAWVRIVDMTIQGYSLERMMNVLDKEPECAAIGVTKASVLLARHKFLNAVYQIPQPTLKGVIQIDEKHFRESQKGNVELINYLPSVIEERHPRYGPQAPALGVMGAEYTTVPVAIDENGYAVAKVVCMGKLGLEIFVDLFYDHIKDASIICTDANNTYIKYCRQFHIVHYVRPSDYVSIITKAGFVTGKDKTHEDRVNNRRVLYNLYNNHQGDYITNKGHLTFKEFEDIKEQYGLSLASVNAFHNFLNKAITINKTNVSSKYLDKYIHFYTFIHNWTVSHNGIQPSSIVDAEEILLYVLKNTNNTVYTLKDFQNEKLTIPKPTAKYHNLLATITSEARREFDNKYLKFNEEDNVYEFKKREYLSNCPTSWIKEVARTHGIPYSRGVTKFSMISKLLQLEDINIVIAQLLLKEKKIHLENEDIDLLNYLKLSDIDLRMNAPFDESLTGHLPVIREDSPLYNPNAYPTAEQKKEWLGRHSRKEDKDDYDGDEDDSLPF